jgi:hypothetical protein
MTQGKGPPSNEESSARTRTTWTGCRSSLNVRCLSRPSSIPLRLNGVAGFWDGEPLGESKAKSCKDLAYPSHNHERPFRPASELVVIRLYAKDVFALGLTLKRTDDPGDLPGHVIIPEINWHDYQTRKTTLKPLIVQLVRLAELNIVFDEDCQDGN